MSRPVVITPEMLRAIFAKPRASDTRPFLVRLISSVRMSVEKGKRGLTVWVSGGAEF